MVSRGRRLGLLGLGTGGEGVSRSRRVAARRGLDRPPPAGPAGGTGQDRAEGDRRRPVPARRRPAPSGEVAGRGGRGRGERRRGGSQHGLRPAAGARLRPRARPRARPSSPTATPHGAFRSRKDLLKVSRLGPKRVRAMRRLPAHHAAGTSRSTPPRSTPRPTASPAASSPPAAATCARSWATPAADPGPEGRGFRRRQLRPAHGARHPGGAGKARPRPAAGLQDRQLRRRASRTSRT